MQVIRMVLFVGVGSAGCVFRPDAPDPLDSSLPIRVSNRIGRTTLWQARFIDFADYLRTMILYHSGHGLWASILVATGEATTPVIR